VLISRRGINKKIFYMNQQIINYIKTREVWRDASKNKSYALSSIWNGLFRFSTFLAYWAVEKFLLDYDKIYQQNPNFKYVFYLSLAFGLWGIIDALWGAYNYFQVSQQTEQLRKQVEDLESSLL